MVNGTKGLAWASFRISAFIGEIGYLRRQMQASDYPSGQSRIRPATSATDGLEALRT
jgi:hypothetical protein